MIITQIKDFNLRCTFCGSCILSCKKNAISTKKDSLGFSYPTVDLTKCCDCSVCVSKCHLENKIQTYSFESITCYEGYSNNNQIRSTSTSGGLARTISEYVIRNNGIVFGASLDENMNVKHVRCDTIESLERISGSKYLQSDTNSSYSQIKKLLSEDKLILFIGTPCQVRGLYSFLGKKPKHLITIDFICHGVPSKKVFADMIKHVETKEKRKVFTFYFRDKINGWKNSTSTIVLSNGKKIHHLNQTFTFYRLFLDNYILRNSCYSCSSASEHCSDLTVGDYWSTQSKDDKGTSLICCNSDVGISIIESIKPYVFIDPIIDKSKLIPCYTNHELSYNIKNKDIFIKEYNKLGYKKYNRKYARKIRRKVFIKKLVSLPRKIAKKLLTH